MALTDPQFVRVDQDWLSESLVYKFTPKQLVDALTTTRENIQALEFMCYAEPWDSRQRGFLNRGLDDWMQAEAIIREIGLMRTIPGYEYKHPYVDLDRFIVRICERRGWATYENIRGRAKRIKVKSWPAEEIRARIASLVDRGALIRMAPSGFNVRGGYTWRYCTAEWLRENHPLQNPYEIPGPPAESNSTAPTISHQVTTS